MAFNSVGESQPSASLVVASLSAAPAAEVRQQPRLPGPMAAPSISYRSSTSASVTWAPIKEGSGGGGAAVRCYHLQLEGPGGGDHPPLPETVYRGLACTFALTNLQAGAAYSLRVCAENEVGLGSWSQSTKFSTKPASEVPTLPCSPSAHCVDVSRCAHVRMSTLFGTRLPCSPPCLRLRHSHPANALYTVCVCVLRCLHETRTPDPRRPPYPVHCAPSLSAPLPARVTIGRPPT